MRTPEDGPSTSKGALAVREADRRLELRPSPEHDMPEALLRVE
jgi:hypothetical protein